jgi:uncharacterized Zn ribbon protein
MDLAAGGDPRARHIDQVDPTDCDAQEIDCQYEGVEGAVLRAEFVRK